MAYYFSNIPMIELVPWAMTLGCWLTAAITSYNTVMQPNPTGGNTKPSSVHPRFWLYLALGAQYGGFLIPQLIYWTTTAANGFHQPEWWREYALPSPPDFFGFDGEVVGRALGSLGVAVGWGIFSTAIIALGDQYATFGVREKPRLSVHGPYEYVRHPLYAGATLVQLSLGFAIWSSIPIHTLCLSIGGTILRIPLEERTLMTDPVLGEQYKRYKVKVRYRYIPYIW